jgi:hypothetical protein
MKKGHKYKPGEWKAVGRGGPQRNADRKVQALPYLIVPIALNASQLSNVFSNTFILHYSFMLTDQVSLSERTTGRIMVVCFHPVSIYVKRVLANGSNRFLGLFCS